MGLPGTTVCKKKFFSFEIFQRLFWWQTINTKIVSKYAFILYLIDFTRNKKLIKNLQNLIIFLFNRNQPKFAKRSERWVVITAILISLITTAASKLYPTDHATSVHHTAAASGRLDHSTNAIVAPLHAAHSNRAAVHNISKSGRRQEKTTAAAATTTNSARAAAQTRAGRNRPRLWLFVNELYAKQTVHVAAAKAGQQRHTNSSLRPDQIASDHRRQRGASSQIRYRVYLALSQQQRR